MNCVNLCISIYSLLGLSKSYNFSNLKMVLHSFPANIKHSIDKLSHSIISISQAITTSHNPHYRIKSKYSKVNGSCFYNSQFTHQSLTRSSFLQRRKDLLPALLGAKSSDPKGEDPRAIETVLKLYSAIKSKNICELSDLIGDECQCLCNFLSSFKPLQGKQQVLEFFSYLISKLGNNIDFVVTPTMQNGMKIGIKWRLEWKNTHVLLGKGFSVHISHVYHGKVLLRNVEMFMEPLLHVEHFRLMTLGIATTLIDKLSSNLIFKNKPKSVIQVLIKILITYAVMFLFKYIMLHRAF